MASTLLYFYHVIDHPWERRSMDGGDTSISVQPNALQK